MAAFQWVNPKGWLVGMAAIAFLDRRADGALAQAAIFATMFTLVALPSCLPWLAFGGALQRFLRAPRARRVLNGAMAALLAASTVLLVNPPLTTRQAPSPPARDRATPPLPGVATLADYQFWTRLRHAGGAPEADAGGSRAAAAPHAVTICSLAGRLWAVPRGRRRAVLPTACGPAQPRSLTRKRDIRTDTQATGRRAEGAASHTVTLLSQNVLRPCYPPNLPDRGGVPPGVPERTPGAAGSPRARSGSVGSPAGAAGRPRSRTSGREGQSCRTSTCPTQRCSQPPGNCRRDSRRPRVT